ncbi:hypothetical protein MIR68_012034 [Amoeboaphelidium protococcarum]|nr:hypothetical protein MIR68_012034 [Amoeboaphelidium protococcarum]
MEIEVKLKLLDKAAHQRVIEHLTKEAKPLGKEIQTNNFFDTEDNALQKVRNVMRIRQKIKSGGSESYVLTLKGNAVLENGVSRVEENEETLSSDEAKSLIEDPTQMISQATSTSKSALLKQIFEKFNDQSGWKKVGSFKNERQKFQWKDYVLEVDETMFQHGTCYEIELEHVDAITAKSHLENWLTSHGIQYSYSKKNKYANMLDGTLI